MAVTASTAHCQVCDRQTLFHKQRINHVLHLILTIVTVGVWGLLVWLPLGIINSTRRPRCTLCGTFRGTKAEQVAQPGALERTA